MAAFTGFSISDWRYYESPLTIEARRGLVSSTHGSRLLSHKNTAGASKSVKFSDAESAVKLTLPFLISGHSILQNNCHFMIFLIAAIDAFRYQVGPPAINKVLSSLLFQMRAQDGRHCYCAAKLLRCFAMRGLLAAAITTHRRAGLLMGLYIHALFIFHDDGDITAGSHRRRNFAFSPANTDSVLLLPLLLFLIFFQYIIISRSAGFALRRAAITLYGFRRKITPQFLLSYT